MLHALLRAVRARPSSRPAAAVLAPLLASATLAAAAIAAPGAASAATFHVRTDGGDAAQCTGRADAPYPGSGSAQACAWKHPYYALPTDGATRIAGGDTLVIGPGDYMIGWGAPGSAGGRCYAGGPYDCYLPPIPSGPSASQPTRILGKQGMSGCTAPPKLWGNERVTKVLNLEGSSNVQIGCLEITDRSDCVEAHSNTAARCERNAAPYGQWASAGITARNSRNVLLRDVNVHGLAHTGIQAGGLTDWTLERVKINGNGWVGWDGDIGAGSSNAGRIVMRQIEIAWNGCGQRWQTGAYWACWAQQAGGYGDGLGTASTGGQWLIEDAYVHHNTSDGIDLLYLDGAATTSVVMRRVYAAANAGNQLKTRGNTTVESSVVVGQCSAFVGRDSMVPGDHCRAQGNALSLSVGANHLVDVQHNTITGEGDCLLLTSGGNNTSRINVRNNALVGQTEYGGGELTCGHYADNSSAVVAFSGNLIWNVKARQCPGGGNTCGQNPGLANTTLAAFSPDPSTGSPLIDRAPAIGTATDYYLQPRAVGNASDIGAVEVQRRRGPSMSAAAPPAPGMPFDAGSGNRLR